MRLLPLAVALAATLSLAACGTNTVTEDSMKSLSEKGLASAEPPLKAKSISCDDDVEAKVGEKGTCRAELDDGRTVVYTLEVDKVDGDDGHMTIVGAEIEK